MNVYAGQAKLDAACYVSHPSLADVQFPHFPVRVRSAEVVLVTVLFEHGINENFPDNGNWTALGHLEWFRPSLRTERMQISWTTAAKPITPGVSRMTPWAFWLIVEHSAMVIVCVQNMDRTPFRGASA
jgi:hypothetical protein